MSDFVNLKIPRWSLSLARWVSALSVTTGLIILGMWFLGIPLFRASVSESLGILACVTAGFAYRAISRP